MFTMAISDGFDKPRGGAIEPSTDLAPDATLVRSLIAGSQTALVALYDRHGSAVFSAAMRASGDRSIAAEVVQETFLALWDRAELFDPSRGTLSAWLARIARNRAIDRIRAAARHDRAVSFSSFARGDADDHSIAEWLTTTGELIGVAGPEPAPETALVNKETRASIEDALGSLDPAERQVIVLAFDGGLSQSEIAASLGWPIGTVKTRTRRALRHLRDRIEGPVTAMPLHSAGAGRDTAAYTGSRLTNVPAVGGGCLAPC
jgi:RNA polymerase sigma-70 factor (ECF subfamily)